MRKAKPGGEIVVVHGAFHGRTYGALSATPQESKQAPFAPLVPGFVVVAPEPAALEAAVHEGTAAVLLEPIQGETGVHPLSEELLQTARAACDRVGAALVFDEIQTGMGRTGTLWAYEQTGVVPDALTTAKALGGGLPIGALVTGERLADVFQPGDHGSTFAGGPLVAARRQRRLRRAATIRPCWRACASWASGCAPASPRCPARANVRGRGLMVAFDADDAPGLVRRALLRGADRPQRDRSRDRAPAAAADRDRRGDRRRARAHRPAADGDVIA